ncbi:hypothetical protein OG455_41465 [Kitasatospora sp. NBC_01287]|uniref:hypothetical protein n=1 Tax=Kitasatospora sp. NBC_01287 TaxID=2903573 RepID=UPI0022591497|nr:hypothetical protein [Kitasatospora sp. NBC_01287]MCX4750953.1 hypothetical protein [Kitasatospora sp. NBC_01287]MCX4751796.1 hypothetical protein [Kitasatospora sp. NBC_01287]MCX4751912.1 hypothetical protein [Kitasatospora sp. NBC_01287]
MGIKLVEEVMDWCPDDVTPAQRWCLTVLARDANDATRETWHGPEHPEILRRIRMTAKKWEAMRSILLKRGLIEPVSGGFRGQAVRYRIASLFAPCVIQDWRKTPLQRGAFGGYVVKGERKDPPGAGVNQEERPPKNGGQSAERPPYRGGPTPLSPPLQSLSSPSDPSEPDPQQPPAAPSDERETIAARPQATPTTAAHRAVRAAGVVPEADEPAFIDWLTRTHNPRGPGWWRTVSAAGDLSDLAAVWRAEQTGAAAQPAGLALLEPCTRCEDANPAARFNPRLRKSPAGGLCPDCHPDAAPIAA